jgi:hypothetical protein
MEEIIKKLVVQLGASSGAIMVVDEEAKVLRCGASYNMPEVWVKLVNPLESSPDRNRNGRVAVTGIAETVNGYNIEFHGHLIASIIIVPVKRSGKVIANIEIITDDKNKAFTVADQDVLEQVANDVLSSRIQAIQS